MRLLTTTILVTIFLGLSTSTSYAQADYKASQEGWEVEMDKAIALSDQTGKPILANFTGTDWCGWCIRLKKSVFQTEHFKEWAKENVVLLEVDFPRRMKLPEEIKAQNTQLAQAFGVQGYPTIWVFTLTLNEDQTERQLTPLAKSGFGPDPVEWTNNIDQQIAQAQAKLEAQ